MEVRLRQSWLDALNPPRTSYTKAPQCPLTKNHESTSGTGSIRFNEAMRIPHELIRITKNNFCPQLFAQLPEENKCIQFSEKLHFIYCQMATWIFNSIFPTLGKQIRYCVRNPKAVCVIRFRVRYTRTAAVVRIPR